MGMGIVFDGGRADLSGLVRPGFSERLYVSHVRQTGVLRSARKAREVAAVTSAGIVVTSAPPPPIDFFGSTGRTSS